mmetsp:Transcript_41333/g.98016  ORF Transcript_41333/g.98016 Transcript_41333/m.98016 type:complete len:228 (+) Transcript_41333:122-805(+)
MSLQLFPLKGAFADPSVADPRLPTARCPFPRAQRLRTRNSRGLRQRSDAAAKTGDLEKAFPFPAWEKLDEVANLQNLGLEIRKEQVPSTSAFPSLPTSPDSKSSKRVLLYRDTNGWCPFCERVICALVEKNIEFDCVYIDLRNKPAWYLDIVETGLVPAAEIDGRLVWESKDILDALEETFPEPSLLPTEFSEDANAASALADTLSRAGFSFLRGREYGSAGPGGPT